MDAGSAVSLQLIHVLVNRGNGAILNATVAEHEIPVLRAVHHPNPVQVVGPTDDVGQFNPSANVEFERLRRKYGRKNAPDYVVRAYPNGALSLTQFGFSEAQGQGSPRSLQKKHKLEEEKRGPGRPRNKAA